jgi:uncharacterized SAM-binding protein YcdF (DUF218 family)
LFDTLTIGWPLARAATVGFGQYQLRRIAIERGVNADAILVEDQSRNSGENVALTRKLLDTNGFLLRRAIRSARRGSDRPISASGWALTRNDQIEVTEVDYGD